MTCLSRSSHSGMESPRLRALGNRVEDQCIFSSQWLLRTSSIHPSMDKCLPSPRCCGRAYKPTPGQAFASVAGQQTNAYLDTGKQGMWFTLKTSYGQRPGWASPATTSLGHQSQSLAVLSGPSQNPVLRLDEKAPCTVGTPFCRVVSPPDPTKCSSKIGLHVTFSDKHHKLSLRVLSNVCSHSADPSLENRPDVVALANSLHSGFSFAKWEWEWIIPRFLTVLKF